MIMIIIIVGIIIIITIILIIIWATLNLEFYQCLSLAQLLLPPLFHLSYHYNHMIIFQQYFFRYYYLYHR